MEAVFEVIGKDTKTGISSRTGAPYVVENLTLNFNGRAAKIKAPKDTIINVGDKVKIQLGTVRGYGVAQIGAIVTEVIPQEKKGE